MALPELLMPAGIKPFTASGHVRSPEPLYGDIERTTGHRRHRRLHISVPVGVDVAVEVSQAELELFMLWHESALMAGAAKFAVQIAKIGPGLEWWEAKCEELTIEHRHGGQHMINMRLRLFGSPTDVGPVSVSMAGEALGELRFDPRSGLDHFISGEAVGALGMTLDLGPLLSGEARGALQCYMNGGPGVNKLSGEAFAHLNIIMAGIEPGDIEGEAYASLVFLNLEDNSIAGEASASLDFDVAGTSGYVATPAAVVRSEYVADTVSTIEVQVRANGEIRSRLLGAGWVVHGTWWDPVTGSIGSGRWVRITHLTGDSFEPTLSDSVGVALSAGSDRVWTLFRTDGIWTLTAEIKVADDPDMYLVGSTCSVALNLEVDPPPI